MQTQLEEVRDIWTKAFFEGDYDVLRVYEQDGFKVVYEEEDRVEASYTRYDLIAHAVQNGVWKPRKLDIEYEEYEFNAPQDQCVVRIGLADDGGVIQEIWQYQQDWKITELRFLKK